MNALATTAQALMAPGKGLLAMDESVSTCDRRLAACGIAPGDEARRRYRELLVSAPGLGERISGAILFEETLHQRNAEGVPLIEVLRAAGILLGIKVDIGTTPLPGHAGERVTEGLDALGARLGRHAALGARFAKWRAVLVIGTDLPSRACLQANAHALARYAVLCQAAGLVPIVEPEVMMQGDHGLARCAEVTEEVLCQVFTQLREQGAALDGLILKPNMVLPGASFPGPTSVGEVADATLDCLLRVVPAAVAGVAFLSGGQSPLLATERLNALHRHLKPPWPSTMGAPISHIAPWPLTFSFGRALQEPAMQRWAGDDAHRVDAQAALLHRARCNGAAALGRYQPAMEADGLPAAGPASWRT
ncbi:class I fructose-bisphosphate aldolase [Roseateles amylovorans]|uniref:fructose-bisphosphate aldolase n=1 Tax=Roseateles amylovorans TaxID=2978473 RepID=A0ABY6AS72_9BURK|nr:class I fructose-bisphosphate aldolase [Roseateles amylovorans]UXH76081.1 fructose-bisphosphate aldolase class I [Roseateles amylovorans]